MIHGLVHTALPDVTLVLLFLFTLPITPICIYLVFHPQYEDGFFGRVGLSLIGVAAFARTVSVFGDAHPITPIGMVLWAGLAIFLVRHCVRFVRREAIWKSARAANERQTAGKGGARA